MKKKLLSIISVILCAVTLMSLVPLTASAATEGYFTYTVSDGKATLTKVATNEGTDIVVPSTLGGYPVVAIGNSCFSLGRITSIVIPSSVETIGTSAFAFCEKLKSVTIRGTNLKTIKDSAFSYCKVLETINLPKSVKSIEQDGFRSCEKLKNINLPVSLENLGKEAFSNCSSLEKIVIHNSIKTIGEKTFYNCENLKEVTISASVNEIKEAAFGLCTKITDVYYTGSESQWNSISIGKYNGPLTSGKLHCNYVIEANTNFEDSDQARVSNNLLLVKTGLGINDILSYAPANSAVKAADGVTSVTGKKPATGMKLILSKGTTYTIVIKGDIDGNGTITAKDARLTLRASANLDKLNDPQKKAADANNDNKLTASDARLILRSSANLEKLLEFEGLEGSEKPTTKPDPKPDPKPQVSSKDYAYLAGTDFRSIRRAYPGSVAQGAYVIAFIDKNGDTCVLTYVRFKIISNYSQVTLHNITKNKTISNPENYYDSLASGAYGANKIKYMNLKVEVMEKEAAAIKAYSDILSTGKNTGIGEYVNAATLNL